jgi:hypothetical protein
MHACNCESGQLFYVHLQRAFGEEQFSFNIYNFLDLKMFILVEWILEGLFSIINVKSITSPRKEYDDYNADEKVEAKYQGKVYPARIVKKSSK